MSVKKDWSNQTVGAFKVLCDSGKRHCGNIIWEVECIYCGSKRNLTKHNMDVNKSCGCKKIELQRKAINKGYGDIYGGHWNTVKKNAKSRDLEFSISIEFTWNLYLSQNGKCALTGVDIGFSKRSAGSDGTASLDRIDSDKGYTEDNVQWLHKDVNFMKQQFDESKFIEWCRKVYIHSLVDTKGE